jgi:hypothetical protein
MSSASASTDWYRRAGSLASALSVMVSRSPASLRASARARDRLPAVTISAVKPLTGTSSSTRATAAEGRSGTTSHTMRTISATDALSTR